MFICRTIKFDGILFRFQCYSIRWRRFFFQVNFQWYRMMLNAGNLQAWFSLKSIYFAKPNIDNFGWACLENVINKFWTRIENTHKRNTRNENEWNEAIYTEHQTKQTKKKKNANKRLWMSLANANISEMSHL